MVSKLRWLCLIFAACAMLYYLTFIRLLGELTGQGVLWSAVTSGAYLCSLGVGVFRSERRFDNAALDRIARIEAALAVVGPCVIAGLYLWHMLYRIYLYDFGYSGLDHAIEPRTLFALVAQLGIVAIGMLAGLEFGLVNQYAIRFGLGSVQSLIAVYHFGGLLASVVLLLGLLPRFEPLDIVCITGATNLLAAFYWRQHVARPAGAATAERSAMLVPTAVLAALITILWRVDLPQLQRKNFYYNSYTWSMDGQGVVTPRFPLGPITWARRAAGLPAVERHRGSYQSIDFLPDRPGKSGASDGAAAAWSMFMDGRFEVSSTFEADYHETLAHMPPALTGHEGKDVLIVGGGDGLLARELLRHGDTVRSITLIDIDAKILDLARRHPELSRLNDAALSNPKVYAVAADAFQALRRDKTAYDRIYVDVLFPFDFETSRLYSAEFFGILARRLKPDGDMAMLSPIDFDNPQPDSEDVSTALIVRNTLARAGFADVCLFAETRHTFLLASPRPPSAEPIAEHIRSRYLSLIRRAENRGRVRSLPLEPHPELVNSILHPTFFGMRDTHL